MVEKKRVLYVGESSVLSTGFGVYTYEVLSRLHSLNKYLLFEHSQYVHQNDPRLQNIPWKVYANMPENEEEQRQYQANPLNQFGGYKFDKIALDCTPQTVFDIRDIWTCQFEQSSPLRPYYNLVWMAPVDSEPQRIEWIDEYSRLDGLFTYTDYGKKTLLEQTNNRLKVIDSAPAGANLKHYYIVPNKRLHKQQWGVSENSFIVGFFSRNQVRKLFPSLMESFAQFLQKAPAELAKKSYLYIHTCYPDVGWNIPGCILENNLSGKVLITYICRQCGHVFVQPYSDSRTCCKKCGGYNAAFPNSQYGIPTEVMGQLYNLLDVYVQYASNEGQSLTVVEAAGCGVPVMGTDYSALEDVIRKLEGVLIQPKAYHRDPATNAWRAIPDNDHLVDELLKFAALPDKDKRRLSFRARMAVEKHYSWDATAQKWEKIIDGLPPKKPWNSPLDLHSPNMNVPPNLSENDFVKWVLVNVAGRPDMVNSYTHLKLARDLTWGICPEQQGGLVYNDLSSIGQQDRYKQFTRQDVVHFARQMCDTRNYWEKRRCGQL